jgi:hypothetical protein
MGSGVVATLWFAVILGVVALAILQRRPAVPAPTETPAANPTTSSTRKVSEAT